MPRVEMSTRPMESREIILAQNEDCGFSNKSHSALNHDDFNGFLK